MALSVFVSIRSAFVGLLIACCVSAYALTPHPAALGPMQVNPDKTAGPQAAPPPPPAPRTGSRRSRVTVTVTFQGKPASRAHVTIKAASADTKLAPVQGYTNAAGLFHTHVRPGDFTVTAIRGTATGTAELDAHMPSAKVKVAMAVPAANPER